MSTRGVVRALPPLAGLVVGLFAWLLVAAPSVAADERYRPFRPPTRAKDVEAKESGGTVTITGWATFSGQIMAGVDDPADDAGPVAANQGAEIIGSDFIYRPENEDFFFRLEVTKIPTAPGGVGAVGAYGDPTVLYGLAFTAKGTSYQLRAHRFGSSDVVNDPLAPAQPAFGLFECEENLCTQVAPLKGGYGTTGERIVMALPLSVLHDNGTDIKEGDDIGGLIAFSTTGSFLGGSAGDPLDVANLLRASSSVTVPVKRVTVMVGRHSVRANLKNGYFDATFPASLFRNPPTTVKTKTCLGQECVIQTFRINK